MQKFVLGLAVFAASANALALQQWKQAASQSISNGLSLNGDLSDAFGCVAEEGKERSMFVQWVNKWGREYKNSGEFETKLKTWIQNNKAIRDFNDASVSSGNHNAVLLDHNGFSDKTTQELSDHLGHYLLDQAEEEEYELAQQRGRKGKSAAADSESEDEDTSSASTAASDDGASSTAGQDNVGILTAGDVDWSWATKPVESQGSCGSCWAFTGNTVLEGTHFAKQNVSNESDRVRRFLSHQYAVDCPGSSYYLKGCNGGDAQRMWTFFQDNGTIEAEQYPYSSLATGQTGSCIEGSMVHDQGLVKDTGFAKGEQELINMIQQRPLATAFNIDSSTFSFYKFGLIKQRDGMCYDTSGTNHQMAVVGYDSQGQSGNHEVQVGDLYGREETNRRPCDPEAGEFLDPMYPGYCLYYVYRTEQTFFDEGAFWKVQNSWGDSWGDKGFAYFEADGTDNGSCNMYQYASQWVKTNLE